MESFLIALSVGLIMYIVGKQTSDSSNNKRFEDFKSDISQIIDKLEKKNDDDASRREERHRNDKEQWIGMFKILSDKLEAIGDSFHTLSAVSVGKVSIDKFDDTVGKIYNTINEVKERLNNCLGCENYKKRG